MNAYNYDADGSVTKEATGKRFGYDAEGRQNVFFASNNNTSTPTLSYGFDGEGKRVKTFTGSSATVFVYDAAGKLTGEYEPFDPAAIPEGYVPRVSYLTNDHLGSPRIVTDGNGAVVSRKDFAAFGDETITTQRTATLGYTAPDIRQDYTGYQKDSESGLEFAQARYYNTQHGRFTSVDPLPASARIYAPQSLNRYSYALNNPLQFVDPTGMDVDVQDDKAKNLLVKTLPKDIRDKVQAAIDKGKGKLTKGSLDKIKSDDPNFAKLKVLVNSKETTEVATSKTGQEGVPFSQRTRGEQREMDIKDYMKSNNVSREEAEAIITPDGDQSEVQAYQGQTYSPNGEDETPKSPTGNLRAVVTDQTGEAASVSEEDAVVAMGHEVYNHSYKFRIGDKGWKNETTQYVKDVEAQTRANYRGTNVKDDPKNTKPKK